MKKVEWLKKANELHTECLYQINTRNGSKPCTNEEVKLFQNLNKVLGVQLSVHACRYYNLKESLDKSIAWAKSGQKDKRFN
ncbi:MAG: hypothetical protein JW841_12070 [Deltaproteobacteria bacterium]|nr:hypothetical protein [Deltaproteobacteria bacterium]